MGHKNTTSLVTICVPFAADARFRKLREDKVEDMLDNFGNPVGAEARADARPAHPDSHALKVAIDAMQRVHFMSISLLRGATLREKTFLVIEMSADGTEKQIMGDLVAHAGSLLLPVFHEVCGTTSLKGLHHLLRQCRVELKASIPHLSGFGRRVIGLGFKGSQDLSLAQIRADADIYAIATEAMARRERDNRGEGKAPLVAGSLLGAAKLQIIGWKHDPLGLLNDPLVPSTVKDVLKDDARMAALNAAMMDGPEPNWTDTDDAPWAKENRPSGLAGIIETIGLFKSVLAGITALLFAIGLVWLGFNARLILFVALGLVAVIGGASLLLTRSERRSVAKDVDPDPRTLRDMMIRENRTPAQNHMISVTHILPETYRKRVTLPLAFRAVEQSAIKAHFRRGFLADIGTIHFARWVVLPGTNRLVFFSNYNANWESYLEDFITKATAGLTGVWSNCVGFPEAEGLFFEGAKDGDRFKRWARKSMVATRTWYSAYPSLSLPNIRRNALIRGGLAKIDTTSDAEACVALFNSVPRPEFALEHAQIQSLVYGASGHLKDSACLAVNFPDSSTEADRKAWLANLLSRVTFGNSRPEDEALYVAFSASGLARLGMHEEVRTRDDPYPAPPKAFDQVNTEFPAVFSFGMDDPTRQRVLNDVGVNAPKDWEWGGRSNPDKRADAVLLLYAKGPETEEGPTTHLDALIERERGALQAYGLRQAHLVRMKRLPYDAPFTEPFGFVDGVSQPLMKGMRVPRGREDELNLVDTGEILLGYRDNRGYFPPSPSVDADRDAGGCLPVPPEALPTRYPKFIPRAEGGERRRDFGRNGSYLVIRQLEQDVQGFEAFTQKTADALNTEPSGLEAYVPASAEYVAAKMVGRWKNGTSLARNPHRPGRKEPDNDFSYASDDPQGHGCPFGAHIRRANPRDSLSPDNLHAISIANRHRILRRGRTFVDTDPQTGKPTEGTFFMCLNADIERQFEFIQQNWCGAPNFHGLSDEVDPIVGQACPHNRFTMPSAGGPKRVDNWQSFVRMRGGGYFFLPGARALDFLAKS